MLRRIFTTVLLLAVFGCGRGAEKLARDLGNEDRSTRQEAAQRLLGMGDAAVPALISAVESGNDTAKYIAAQILGKLGDKRAVGPLMQLLKHDHEYIRAVAAEALGKLGDRRVLGPLSIAAKDSFSVVRKSAIEAIGNFRSPDMVPLLLSALKDPSPDVRKNAVAALAYFQSNIELANPRDDVIDAIEAAASDPDESVRYVAVQALGNLRDRTAVPILIDMIAWNEDISDWNEPSTWVRQEAVIALGKIGDLDAVKPLEEFLSRAGKDEQKVTLKVLEDLTGNKYILED